MTAGYFSDREQGERSRTGEQIDKTGWLGIFALINSRIEDGSFGREYPRRCGDGDAVIGTDVRQFRNAMRAEIAEGDFENAEEVVPSTAAIIDMLEFCFTHVAQPREVSYHSCYSHHHLVFDVVAGQTAFRDKVNQILARLGLAFEMNQGGKVFRRGSGISAHLIESSVFATGDAETDALLEDARRRFKDPSLDERKIGLEKLWDAFERIKTLEDRDKPTGIRKLLDLAATEPVMRASLEDESRALTKIGNDFRIRHHETTKPDIVESAQIDALFHRMFAFIWLILCRSQRLN